MLGNVLAYSEAVSGADTIHANLDDIFAAVSRLCGLPHGDFWPGPAIHPMFDPRFLNRIP